MTKYDHTGGCLCGAVRFAFTGDPAWVVLCHCDYCKTILGSGLNHECLVEPRRCRLTQGTPQTYAHRSRASGKRVEHRFCGTCGTPLFLTGERFSDVGIFRGALDWPNRIRVTPRNALQIFPDDALPSGMVLPAIAAFGQHRRAPDDTIREGTVHDHPWRIGDRRSHNPANP